MKAIVFGATGLVGRAVVEKLILTGQVTFITAITRRPVDFGSIKVINQVIDFEKMANFP